jgi:hypothetical protein
MSDILVQYQRFSLPSVQANLILRRPGRKRGIKPLADIKAGAPFGMDGAMLSKIDWTLALKRVSHDLRTDFIYAPHLGFIYSKAGDELIAKVNSELKSGQYSPGLPLTIEVPKSFRM